MIIQPLPTKPKIKSTCIYVSGQFALKIKNSFANIISASIEKHGVLTGKQSVTPLDSNVMTARFTTPASSPTLSNKL